MSLPGSPSGWGEVNLALVAVVHGDPAGYRRAWRFFEHFQPELITVEISPFSVRYRRSAWRTWRRCLAEALAALPPGRAGHLPVARVAAQADLPFEYRAARDWGRRRRTPVKLLDAGALSRRQLPRFAGELFSPANLRQLAELPASGTLAEFVAQEFRRARLAWAGAARRWPPAADPEIARRERLWARRLRRWARPGRRLAHLGGWEHLVPWAEGGGLTPLLDDLKPRIFLLDEADYLLKW